ncbi:MAG: hypothetical protein Q7Q71_09840 [Verrucomicrobiota bacterium JB023]|nr:hypothetical protein [Verrucomicrobiota bacterium JB023]
MSLFQKSAFLFSLPLLPLPLIANDRDGDTLVDTIEIDTATFPASDWVLQATDLDPAQITGDGGGTSDATVFNQAAISFDDTESGFGYYVISKWSGDQSDAYAKTFHFGLAVRDLDLAWATTTTRDVALVAHSGREVNVDLRHGLMQHQLPSAAFGEVCQYSISLLPETFDSTEEKLREVLADLSHIEIRAEFWKGVSGVESYLLPAGQYAGAEPDTDGDGIADADDTDSDNDGLSDEIEGFADSDGDGLADYRDLDSDDDGLLDSAESTADTDTDGTPNYLDPDSDGDGMIDGIEGLVDSDQDGLANAYDLDSDNDGLTDAQEGALDIDGDGLGNFIDLDIDGDGINDNAFDDDLDGDGILNHFEAAEAAGSETELVANWDFQDGTASLTSDYTRDLLSNEQLAPGGYSLVQDSIFANDGFASFLDAGSGNHMMVVYGRNIPGEVVWEQEVEVTPSERYAFSVSVATGLAGRAPFLDLRVDGVSLGETVLVSGEGDFVRTYASYDGGSSSTITLQIVNTNNSGIPRIFALDKISFVPFDLDTDGDGTANMLDTDSDGDGLSDSFEGYSDTDEDLIPDYVDLDADGDSIPDAVEGASDGDNDGTPSYLDGDSDNDLIEDWREGTADSDGDGILDLFDTDADNDGIEDTPGEDSDSDGLWNTEEGTGDPDGDGIPNFLDTDSDGDGLSDAEEGLDDDDVDGVPDYLDFQPPFSCNDSIFQSYGSKTQLAMVDLVEGSFLHVGNNAHAQHYNAIGYNPTDNYIYGLECTNTDPILVRIGSDGSYARLGEIEGLPRSFVAGSFDENGIYYTQGNKKLYAIDVASRAVIATHTTGNGGWIDLAYNPVTKEMYGSGSRNLYQVDVTTGSTTKIGRHGKTFGALVSDSTGTIYGLDNGGTGAFRVNTTNADVVWVANSPKTSINDATICPTAMLGLDTDGDGLKDNIDLDDDNDGIADVNEPGLNDPNGDEDGDGIPNWTDNIDDGDWDLSSTTDYTDSNGDGIPDVYDNDGDGTPNHLDSDSDNDGLADANEAPGDYDSDGLPNFLDADADNDGLADGSEGVTDTDGDGKVNYLDEFDDRDQDNDGIANGDEGTGDYDNDGIPNYLDTDSDNDGIADSEEILDNGIILDSDGDGQPNFVDIDDDGDGIETPIDDCPLCNLEDNIIEFDLTDAQIANYGVDPLYYDYARDVWNEVKFELNCNTDGVPLEEEKRGFDEERFYLLEDSEVFVTVIYDGARNVNSVAWYDAGDPATTWDVFWQKYGTGPTAPLIPGSTATLGILPAGTELRFGLVADGGRGGVEKIYQDPYLNKAGLELIASNIEVEGDPLIVAFEDQLHAGRDNDFNDVIFMVEIVPTAPATLQFGPTGLASTEVTSVLNQLGWNDESYEVSGDLFDLPASGAVTIDLLGDPSELDFSLALVDYELLDSVVPELLQFRSIAGLSAVTVLDNLVNGAGSQISFNPEELGLAGKQVILVALPHNRFDRFITNPHRYTPRGDGDDTKRQPLFSLINANPGSLDQFLTFTDGGTTLVMVEDHSRLENGEAGTASDSDFADFWFRITPALTSYSIGGGGYYHSSTDPTTNWDGIDGYSEGIKGDF